MAVVAERASKVENGGGSSTLTLSAFSPTGSDRCAFILITHFDSGANVTSVTRTGDTPVFVGRRTTGGDNVVEIWKIVAPVTGSADVVITWDTADDNSAAIINYNGVDQTTPNDTFVSQIGTSANASFNVTSETDDYVIDVIATTEADPVEDGSQVRVFKQMPGDHDNAGSDEAGATTVTMSWTNGGGKDWAQGAVNINQASGSTPVNRIFNIRHDIKIEVNRVFNVRHDIIQFIGRAFNIRHDIKDIVGRIFNIRHDILLLVGRTFNLRHDLSGAVNRIFNVRHDISDFVNRVFNIRHDISDFVNREFTVRHDISEFVSRAFNVRHDISDFVNRVFNIRHDIAQTTWKVEGDVRDLSLDVVGTVRCILVKQDGAGEASRIYIVQAHTNANGSGLYTFGGLTDNDPRYMVIAYNDEATDRRGVTNDNLTPVVE